MVRADHVARAEDAAGVAGGGQEPVELRRTCSASFGRSDAGRDDVGEVDLPGSTLSSAEPVGERLLVLHRRLATGSMSASRARTATLVVASGSPDSFDHAAAHLSGFSAPQANAFFSRAM